MQCNHLDPMSHLHVCKDIYRFLDLLCSAIALLLNIILNKTERADCRLLHVWECAKVLFRMLFPSHVSKMGSHCHDVVTIFSVGCDAPVSDDRQSVIRTCNLGRVLENYLHNSDL
jgi:hypothetical protein